MADPYLWLKALHIISVISWMAGLLYLPRLFVYHVGSCPGSALSEQLKIMEFRLARFIMLPASLASWAFGMSAVAWSGELLTMPAWLLLKLVLVVLLSCFHALLEKHRHELSVDGRLRGGRYFRLINEIPTVLMILIVVVVVVRPF